MRVSGFFQFLPRFLTSTFRLVQWFTAGKTRLDIVPIANRFLPELPAQYTIRPCRIYGKSQRPLSTSFK